MATLEVWAGLVATADETRKRPGEGKLNLVGCETYAASRHLSPVLRGPRPVKKKISSGRIVKIVRFVKTVETGGGG